jgi:hypothetical protein
MIEILYYSGLPLSAESEGPALYGYDIKNAVNNTLDTALECIREDTSHFLDVLLYQTLTRGTVRNNDSSTKAPMLSLILLQEVNRWESV